MSNDLWRTPKEVVNYIESRFGKVKIDLCASDENKIAEFNINESDDFLNDHWIESSMVDLGDLCWMNPPYSNPLPFVEQAIKWSNAGYAVAGILNNDSSTKWFTMLEQNAQLLMPITGGRIAFLDKDGKPINGNNKPQIMFYLAPFGTQVKQTDHVNIKDIYPNGKPRR